MNLLIQYLMLLIVFFCLSSMIGGNEYQNCPVLGKEYERVRAGKPPVRIDFESRYKVELPPASKKNDDAAWKQYLQKNQRSLQQKMIE